MQIDVARRANVNVNVTSHEHGAPGSSDATPVKSTVTTASGLAAILQRVVPIGARAA